MAPLKMLKGQPRASLQMTCFSSCLVTVPTKPTPSFKQSCQWFDQNGDSINYNSLGDLIITFCIFQFYVFYTIQYISTRHKHRIVCFYLFWPIVNVLINLCNTCDGERWNGVHVGSELRGTFVRAWRGFFYMVPYLVQGL